MIETNEHIRHDTIIAGDINAHNPLWDYDGKLDNKGSIIADIILNSNFMILNTGEHTFQSSATGQTSAIDVTIAHNSIANKISWQKSFENLGSDHFVIKLEL